MERLLLNLKTAGKVRRVLRNGRSYLVAPATILVPGVLAGSEGPLFYPPQEVAASPGVWNDTPIVVYHPTENGFNVAARNPRVLDEVKIGRVYNDHITRKGTRRVEAWFDEERTKAVDNRIHKALLKGQPLELSTGLYTDNELKDGTYNGKGYTAVARNYRPDHLAILPDQVGACSVKDGCGVFNTLVTNRWTPVTNEEGAGEQTSPAMRCKCKEGETCPECEAELPTANYGGKNAAEKMLALVPQMAKRFPGANVIGLSGGRVLYDDKGRFYVIGYTEEYGQCTLDPGAPTELTEEPTISIPTARNAEGGAPSEDLDLTPEKACQIVKDGSVHGKELTEAQRGRFGAKCGERKKTANAFTPLPESKPVAINYFVLAGIPVPPGWKPL